MSEQPSKPKQAKPPKERWHPPTYETEDIRAIQAIALFASGQRPEPPSQRDCQTALDWIVNTAAGTYEEIFLAGQQDVGDYLAGRRSVGLAIVKMTKLKAELMGRENE